VHRYRTEIVVPADRYVCLRLPDHLPEGRAFVTVDFADAETPTTAVLGESPPFHEDADREDIEWWEEFDEDGGDAAGPTV
jgi:hypothetical protein